MNKLFRILFLSALLCISLLAYSQKVDTAFDDNQGVEIVINGDKVIIQNLPHDGVVEVFNVLGAKVTSFVISGGYSTARVNIPKGYYILKSDNVTKKIVVK